MEEKVSIIVPVYNAEKYIRETIDCVKAQTYENWELVLVEDGSTDESLCILETVERQDGRIRVIRVDIL